MALVGALSPYTDEDDSSFAQRIVDTAGIVDAVDLAGEAMEAPTSMSAAELQFLAALVYLREAD